MLPFIAFSGAAEEPPEKIRFIEEADWPPFTYEKSGLATKGLSYELMKSVFSPLNTAIEINLMPQKRMLITLEKGLADGATVISKNSERLKYLEYSAPLLSKMGKIYYLVSKLNSFEWEDYEDLALYKIGVVRGHNYGEEFDAASAKYSLKLNQVSSTEQLFKMLKLGRLDLVLVNEWTALHFQSLPEYVGLFKSAKRPYYQKGYHIGLAKNSPHISRLPEINDRIDELKNNGTIEKLVSKFFSK